VKLAPTYPAAALAQSPPVISVRGVTQRFGEAGAPQTVLALDNVSLEIRRGEFLTLLGPSGCGKSTLLNIVGGLMSPTEGAVTVNDTAVRSPLPQKIAFVFQESTLFPWYTVAENFALNFKYRGVARSEWRERTMAALKSVQMDTFADHFPNQLSIGMRQRVNVARGLSSGTEILLMDEPFAALDEQTRMLLGEDLSVLLSQTAKTIVFVTHSLAEAVFLSDRVVLMTARPGRIQKIIEIDEPHPRLPGFMLEPRFSEWRNECYASLRDEIRQAITTAEGTAP
jgi:ABC-type nitrate/sulfonate/bicarbonate transport system ATPase subunit